MKRQYLIIPFILLIFSCDNKEEHFNYLPYITAGQKEGIGIRYINIDPDDTLNIIGYPDTLEFIKSLDLNSDNISDFELKYNLSTPYMLGASSGSLRIIPLGENSICVSNEETHWVDSIAYNDTINKYNNWSDSTALLYSHTWFIDGSEYTSGYWYGDKEKYVGVRVLKGENSFFGWIDIKQNIIRQFAITEPY
jgi:hypothetical protein